MATQQNPISTITRYAIVGVSVALVYLLAFMLLDKAHLFPTMMNSVIAFVGAVMFQYIAQGAFTFRRPLNNPKQIIRFITTVSVGLVISSLIVGYVGPILGLSNFISSIIVVVLLPVFNLMVFMFWVFVAKTEKMI